MKRRDFFKKVSAVAAVTAVVPVMSFAGSASKPTGPNKMDFKTALNAITGGKTPKKSKKVKLKAPEIAENGAVVPVGITSEIEGTTEIIIITANNPTPLAAKYTFGERAIPAIKSRFKMGKTTDVIALVKAGDKFYTAKANVKVTKGGCGG